MNDLQISFNSDGKTVVTLNGNVLRPYLDRFHVLKEDLEGVPLAASQQEITFFVHDRGPDGKWDDGPMPYSIEMVGPSLAAVEFLYSLDTYSHRGIFGADVHSHVVQEIVKSVALERLGDISDCEDRGESMLFTFVCFFAGNTFDDIIGIAESFVLNVLEYTYKFMNEIKAFVDMKLTEV